MLIFMTIHTTSWLHHGSQLKSWDYSSVSLYQVSNLWYSFTNVQVLHYVLFNTHADDAIVRSRLSEALDAVLNRAQEPAKSKKVQHANAKNAVLFETVNLIIHFEG